MGVAPFSNLSFVKHIKITPVLFVVGDIIANFAVVNGRLSAVIGTAALVHVTIGGHLRNAPLDYSKFK